MSDPGMATQRVNGRLSLRFWWCEETRQTRLQVPEQQPPLKVIRAFPIGEGGALVHLHNISGGVLGGDRLEMAVEVGPRAYAQLTTTSSTLVYRSNPDVAMATQSTRIHVKEGGLLEYLPDPLNPFAEARYRQSTQIQLERDAGLFWWEVIAPGWEVRGELFPYRQVSLDCEIAAEGRPLAIERFRLEPEQRPLASLARLGPYRYVSSFYICRVGLQTSRWFQLERELSTLALQRSIPGEISWGVSTLVAHGLVIKALSRRECDITAGLPAFWKMARQALYGREALPPRKIY